MRWAAVINILLLYLVDEYIKSVILFQVELTNIQKKYYRAILERNFDFLVKGATYANVPSLMNTMMELRKCCLHPYLLKGSYDIIDLLPVLTLS